MHEEDFGLLWKHYDASTEHAETRRMRRLVVSFIITIGNYDYAFYWYLYLDGTIEAEVKATGVMLTQGLVASGTDHGVAIGDDLVAPHHQHFFCARLDMEVDGGRNSVYEVNTAAVEEEGPKIPTETHFARSPRGSSVSRKPIAGSIRSAAATG